MDYIKVTVQYADKKSTMDREKIENVIYEYYAEQIYNLRRTNVFNFIDGGEDESWK
jgi:hypothetical protein